MNNQIAAVQAPDLYTIVTDLKAKTEANMVVTSKLEAKNNIAPPATTVDLWCLRNFHPKYSQQPKNIIIA